MKVDDGAEDKSSFFNLSETRLYIVIGLIAALVFLAILQAICTIYQTSSKSRNQKVTTIFSDSILLDLIGMSKNRWAFNKSNRFNVKLLSKITNRLKIIELLPSIIFYNTQSYHTSIPLLLLYVLWLIPYPFLNALNTDLWMHFSSLFTLYLRSTVANTKQATCNVVLTRTHNTQCNRPSESFFVKRHNYFFLLF